MTRRAVLAGLATLLLFGCATHPSPADTTYYLVRHAEKTAEKPDPALTPEGEQRAQDLAQRLANVPLTAIYSSDYKRTRDTAAPIAAAANLDVTIYNPRDLKAFAKTLSSQKGHILIVGHSNTTPQLSALLGGPAGKPIVEATEYDRFYVLQRRGLDVTGRIEKFGK